MSYRKAHNLLHFLVLAFPILCLIFAVFRTGDLDIISNTSLFTTFIDIPLFDNLDSLIRDVFVINDNILYANAYSYLCYICIVELVSLIFEFFLFIPRWLRGCMRKYEKE